MHHITTQYSQCLFFVSPKYGQTFYSQINGRVFHLVLLSFDPTSPWPEDHRPLALLVPRLIDSTAQTVLLFKWSYCLLLLHPLGLSVYSPISHWSYGTIDSFALVLYLIGHVPHWSYIPLVLCHIGPDSWIPLVLWSNWLFLIGPISHWSYVPLVLYPIGHVSHWSYIPLVLCHIGPDSWIPLVQWSNMTLSHWS